jgi:hypothetical protein
LKVPNSTKKPAGSLVPTAKPSPPLLLALPLSCSSILPRVIAHRGCAHIVFVGDPIDRPIAFDIGELDGLQIAWIERVHLVAKGIRAQKKRLTQMAGASTGWAGHVLRSRTCRIVAETYPSSVTLSRTKFLGIVTPHARARRAKLALAASKTQRWKGAGHGQEEVQRHDLRHYRLHPEQSCQAPGQWGDIIRGLAGNDQVSAGPRGDTIKGGAGFDDLRGNGGRDNLDGGDDADSCDGGNGNDVVKGGAGDDLLFGSAGNDKVYGGAGNDSGPPAVVARLAAPEMISSMAAPATIRFTARKATISSRAASAPIP